MNFKELHEGAEPSMPGAPSGIKIMTPQQFVAKAGDMPDEGDEEVEEGKPGLWANIHAKRERIKHGSGEHMRTPGSKGAPTADALKKSATEGMAEGSVTPDVNVSKVHDDGHEKEWHIYRGKEMIGYVIKNQPDTAEGLYIAYGHGPGRAFVEEFAGLKPAVNYITSLKEGVAEGSLNEFAQGSGGGESGRWYTDDEMTDIVGDGWWQDMDVSGANIGVIDSEVPKEYMIQEAQAWLDDQGYSVQVLNCKVNDDDMEWYIEGSFQNSGFAKKGMAESQEHLDRIRKLSGLGEATKLPAQTRDLGGQEFQDLHEPYRWYT